MPCNMEFGLALRSITYIADYNNACVLYARSIDVGMFFFCVVWCFCSLSAKPAVGHAVCTICVCECNACETFGITDANILHAYIDINRSVCVCVFFGPRIRRMELIENSYTTAHTMPNVLPIAFVSCRLNVYVMLKFLWMEMCSCGTCVSGFLFVHTVWFACWKNCCLLNIKEVRMGKFVCVCVLVCLLKA